MCCISACTIALIAWSAIDRYKLDCVEGIEVSFGEGRRSFRQTQPSSSSGLLIAVDTKWGKETLGARMTESWCFFTDSVIDDAIYYVDFRKVVFVSSMWNGVEG